VFSFEDSPNVVLIPYVFEFLRNTLKYGIYTEPRGFSSFFLTTTALGPDNRVNKTLGIATELKITSQVVYCNQQVSSFLAYGGSFIMKTVNNSSFDMWRVVRIEVKILANTLTSGTPLAVRIWEHRHNLKEGILDKSKLAQHAYEEGHRVGWDEPRVLEIESNRMYRKYKESAHMACLINLISQPSLDISPLWICLISKEVSKSKGKFV
jgi:hypothetical protein